MHLFSSEFYKVSLNFDCDGDLENFSFFSFSSKSKWCLSVLVFDFLDEDDSILIFFFFFINYFIHFYVLLLPFYLVFSFSVERINILSLSLTKNKKRNSLFFYFRIRFLFCGSCLEYNQLLFKNNKYFGFSFNNLLNSSLSSCVFYVRNLPLFLDCYI